MGRLVKEGMKFLGPLLALGLLFSTSIAQADKESAKEFYKTASRLFQAEEFEAALPYFEKAYEASGQRPVTILGLAQCERALKKYDDAIKHFEEYLASKPPKDKAERIRSTLEITRTLRESSPPPPPGSNAKPLPTVLTTPPPPPIRGPGTSTEIEQDQGLLGSTWFWIATGLVVVSGAVVTGYALTTDSDADPGSTGVLIRP